MSRLFGEAPERRVVGEYTADGEEVEEEEESGSIDLEQAEDPVSETAMGCVSREVEEGGGVEGQTPGLTGPPSAAAGLAVLKVGSPDSLTGW